MQFQPGQSGNPAGRPPGSRNHKTVIIEEWLSAAAGDTAKWILRRAWEGDRTAMRLVMERTAPAGIDRPLRLELPPVKEADDLIAAAGTVLKALAAGGLSSRETVSMLTVVERLGRIAERAQQMKERRAGRHEAPAPEAPAATNGADAHNGAALYSPVNSHDASVGAAGEEAATSPTVNGEALYSPVNSPNETAGAAAPEASPAGTQEAETLYSPVNSSDAPSPGADAALTPLGSPPPASGASGGEEDAPT